MEGEYKDILLKYEGGGFTKDQLFEIERGLQSGLDVSVYARKGIPAEDMSHIRKSLFLKKSEEKNPEPKEDDYEEIEEGFKSYRASVQVSVYEKLVTFAITIAILAILGGIFEMLILFSKL